MSRRIYGPIWKSTFGHYQNINIGSPVVLEQLLRQEGKYPMRSDMALWKEHRDTRRLPYGPFTEEGERWYRLRQVLNKRLLKPSEALLYADAIGEVVSDLMVRLREERSRSPSGVLVGDVANLLYRFALEGISYILFETRIGCLKQQVPAETQHFIDSINLMFKNSIFATVLPRWSRKVLPFWDRYLDSWDTIFAFDLQHAVVGPVPPLPGPRHPGDPVPGAESRRAPGPLSSSRGHPQDADAPGHHQGDAEGLPRGPHQRQGLLREGHHHRRLPLPQEHPLRPGALRHVPRRDLLPRARALPPPALAAGLRLPPPPLQLHSLRLRGPRLRRPPHRRAGDAPGPRQDHPSVRGAAGPPRRGGDVRVPHRAGGRQAHQPGVHRSPGGPLSRRLGALLCLSHAARGPPTPSPVPSHPVPPWAAAGTQELSLPGLGGAGRGLAAVGCLLRPVIVSLRVDLCLGPGRPGPVSITDLGPSPFSVPQFPQTHTPCGAGWSHQRGFGGFGEGQSQPWGVKVQLAAGPRRGEGAGTMPPRQCQPAQGACITRDLSLSVVPPRRC
uniref:Cytochrome P450 family 27 subfamily A member 1 n=1 Tax=Anas platyrhynchos platyrhynchos TaxID=8840 RepID=A0A493TG64_ANAPP